MKTVKIELNFGKEVFEDKVEGADVQTNDVSLTMVVNRLQAIVSQLCQNIVDDAEEFVPKDKMEEYLDARIKVDREKFYKKH